MVERSLSMREVPGSIPGASTTFEIFLFEQLAKKSLHRPGIEPGPPAWQASILPLNQRCLHLEVEVMSTYSLGEETKNLEHVFENLRKSRVLRMQKLICFEMLTFVRVQIGILGRTCMFPRCSSCKVLFCSFRGLPFPQF